MGHHLDNADRHLSKKSAALEHIDKHQHTVSAHEKMHQESHDRGRVPDKKAAKGHAQDHQKVHEKDHEKAHEKPADRAHVAGVGNKTEHKNVAHSHIDALKHLPALKIVGFDPGECLRGEASHYGKGDGTYGNERRDGSIHRPGPTAAMRLAEAKNITVSVRNIETGAQARLLVNDYGPRVDTRRLIDINSSMRKTLFNKDDVASVEVCRIK